MSTSPRPAPLPSSIWDLPTRDISAPDKPMLYSDAVCIMNDKLYKHHLPEIAADLPDGMWYIPTKGFNSQRSPSTNIHYNSQKHWVTTIQYENGDIYLLDSDLGKNMDLCLNDSLKIQLAQMNGHGKSKLKSSYITITTTE